jgi:hypothetical protein
LEVLAFSNSSLTSQQIYDTFATSAAKGWTQDQRAVRGLAGLGNFF